MSQLNIPQTMQLAIACHREGKLEEAASLYLKILGVNPNEANVLNLLGRLQLQIGRPEAALELLNRASAVAPEFDEAWLNLGSAQQMMNHWDDAEASYCRALKLNPRMARAHANLGGICQRQKRFGPAIEHFERALELEPSSEEMLFDLGIAYHGAGRLEEAAACLEKLLIRRPDYYEAHRSLGEIWVVLGEPDKALNCFLRSVELKSEAGEIYSNIANILKDLGRINEAIAMDRRAVKLSPKNAQVGSNLVYSLSFQPGVDAAAIQAELSLWRKQHADPLKQFIVPHERGQEISRRLRIGYVSSNFRDHVVGRNFLPLIREHDVKGVEVYCYATVEQADAIASKIKSHAAVWRGVAGKKDEDVAARIREDKIDILVDLTMHMGESRLTLFARKPVPIQATFMAYPGSTGLDTIDYRFTDPFLDPPGMDDEIYSEASIRLPDSFWCYDAEAMGLDVTSPVAGAPALENGFVTFGCLNNFGKVNDGVLSLWARVLAAIPNSHLVLLAPPGGARERTHSLLRAWGIVENRIRFESPRPRVEYLKLYEQIDIALDTLPYNGHTTSLDALWMGLPLVTIAGNTVVGRAGFSQLSNLGFGEWVARSDDEYIARAVEFGRDVAALASLRQTIRQRMLASPLMDAPRFARNVEAGYRAMWVKWCESQSSPG